MRLKHENITVKYNIIFHNVLFIFNLQQKKWHSVFTCFSSESHFLITQEPRMTKIRDSNMHGIIKKNVARLQVTVNELGLLLVQILHGLGYFKGPNDSVFERWKWHHSLPAPGPGPVQPLLQCGAEMLRDHPRAPGRVDARAHEMKHKPVTLGERFEFLLLIFLIKINKTNIFHIKKTCAAAAIGFRALGKSMRRRFGLCGRSLRICTSLLPQIHAMFLCESLRCFPARFSLPIESVHARTSSDIAAIFLLI